jgi:acyl carrier protein
MTVYDVIMEYFKENFDTSLEITLESKLIEDLGCDSLDVVDLIVNLENKLDLSGESFDLAFAYEAVTVGDLISAIKREYSIE